MYVYVTVLVDCIMVYVLNVKTCAQSPHPLPSQHTVAIDMAQRDGIDWLLHIDTDELVYPATAGSFNLQHLLAAQPQDVDLIVFPNYESLPESETVTDPFLEVGCGVWG